MRHLILAALILALTPAAALARDRALVVGINLYPKITVQGVAGQKNLHGPVADAHTFQKLLTDDFGFAPDEVKVLVDQEASHDAIIGNIKDWLIDGTQKGDRAVFYFAGHGISVLVTDPDGTKRLTSGLAPADAAGEAGSDVPKFQGLILGPTMKALLDQMADRQVMVFVDACESGSVTRELSGAAVAPADVGVRTLTPRVPANISERDITPDITRQSKVESRLLTIKGTNSNLIVWHAATLAQVTFDYPGRDGGVFTQSFADGLHGKAAIPGRGIVTASALRDYVQSEAARICKQLGEACSAGLTPELEAPDDYRASILAPKKAAEAPPPPPGAEAVALQADSLLTHANDFDLQAEIIPGTDLHFGQQVQFRVHSSEAGHLILLDAGPDGKLTQIFPNPQSESAHKDGAIRADAPITIPDASYGFAFTAQTRGAGSLIAIVCEKTVDLKSIMPAAQGLTDISSRLLSVTAAKLQAPVLSPKPDVPNRAARWAFVRVPYSVN